MPGHRKLPTARTPSGSKRHGAEFGLSGDSPMLRTNQMLRVARSLLCTLIVPALDCYELGDQLGVGGMGVVYDGCAPTGERVAIKVLRVDRRDEGARRRFRDESIAGRVVTHPNLVAILDEGECDGVPYLVMRPAPGGSLGMLVRDGGALPLDRSIAITRQVLEALDALHGVGVIHADVKSDNVLVDVTDKDRVTLIDLGLARIEHAGDERSVTSAIDGERPRPRQRECTISGTPEYMAPELAWGAWPTVESDLYAVGCMLYELVTGTPPFFGGSSREILRSQLRDDVVPPSLRNPDCGVTPALERVMLHAVQKHPKKRFPSARAFIKALAIAEHSIPGDVVARAPGFATDTPTLEIRNDRTHRRRRAAAATASLRRDHAA